MVVIKEYPELKETKCKNCNAVLTYEHMDIQTETFASNFTTEYIKVIICAHCNEKVSV